MGKNGSVSVQLRSRVQKDTVAKEIKDASRVVVSFSDLSGRHYNVSLLNDGTNENLASIQKQLREGLCTDGSSFPGLDLDTSNSDMLLAPDLGTLKVWERSELNPDGSVAKETVAHVWAYIRNPDGTSYDCCPRTILERAVKAAQKKGFVFKAGSEQEFFVSQVPEKLVHVDKRIYYQDVPVWLARAALRAMRVRGIDSNYIHHEVANSQFEVQVKYDDAPDKADGIFLYKEALREAAAPSDLATLPHALADSNKMKSRPGKNHCLIWILGNIVSFLSTQPLGCRSVSRIPKIGRFRL